jgi:ribosomal protein S12 methylthiotransferase accessory factor
VPADLLLEVVSPKVGLVQSVVPQARDEGEPCPPYLAVASLANFGFTRLAASERVGAGKGVTPAEATIRAIAEALERYCAYQGDPTRTVLATAAMMGEGVIRPSDLVLYSDEQYERPGWEFPRWSEDLAIAWMQAVELPSGSSVAVPAGFAYLSTAVPPQFAPASSNGLAAGATLVEAVLGGLCEMIERDAFLVAWMHRLPAVRLDLRASGDVAASIVHQYGRAGVEVRAYVLPSDLPAVTVLAVALDDNPAMPAQVVGLGCHPSPAVALSKALFEVCQARPSEAFRRRDKPPAGRLLGYGDVATLDDHSAFAGLPERRSEFAFLDASGISATVAELPDRATGSAASDLDSCVAALVRQGLRVAYVDLTLPDVRSVGLHVVRVLVTDLQPIHFGAGLERLGGARLFSAPQQLGFGGVRTAADLNPCPHPLA